MVKYNIRFFRSEEIYAECLNLSKKQIKTKLEQELVNYPYLYFFRKQKIELAYFSTGDYIEINNYIEMILDIKGKIFRSMNDIDPLYSDFKDDKLYNKVCSSLFKSKHLNYFNKKGDMIELKFGSVFSLVYYIDWSFFTKV